jgi:Na+/H+ antiporter NhaD/arsenite permease-like protein
MIYMRGVGLALLALITVVGVATIGHASTAAVAGYAPALPTVFGIPLDFILFACTLLGVALFHDRVLQVALTGLTTILLYKFFITGFKLAPGMEGLVLHFAHEWVILANLLCLLLGFAILADHFEKSQVPEMLPRYLRSDWTGPFVLLAMIFVLSSFLDNIAAAIIGGTVANIVFRHKVHIGYVAAIVAASNAGGSGSVVGDTTTTMMWIAGISPIDVFHGYVAAVVAFVVCGIPAAIQQHRYQPLAVSAHGGGSVDTVRVGIVFFILTVAIVANIMSNTVFTGSGDVFPVIGVALWLALLASALVRQPSWGILPEAFKGSIFLLSLVTCASLMPVEQLPLASWQTAMGLGFVSSVFDNIPLTALAIKQGGYDWGMLAYAVGFGGSMIWFGSSAGVAICNNFPQARSVTSWVKNGWHVTVGYVVGFFVMLWTLGWQPHAPVHHNTGAATPVVTAPAVPTVGAPVLPKP